MRYFLLAVAVAAALVMAAGCGGKTSGIGLDMVDREGAGSGASADIMPDARSNSDAAAPDEDALCCSDWNRGDWGVTDASWPPSGGAFGAPCFDNGDCQSNLCVWTDQGGVCTSMALEECPEGYSAQAVPDANGETIFVCVPESSTGIGIKPGGAQDIGYFRYLLKLGEVPLPTDMEIEGFLNEHDTELPPPDPALPITLHGMMGLHRLPWSGSPEIALQIGMNAAMKLDDVHTTVTLAVVVDRSGSMDSPNKMPYVKEGLHQLVDKLAATDNLAIVVYDDYASVLRHMAPLVDRADIHALIDSIHPGGSTNLCSGMVLGYEEVVDNYLEGGLNRIMLISDGEANEGIIDTGSIVAKSQEYNDMGIGITTIGVGYGFNQELMLKLAEQGNGNHYFIEDPAKLTTVFTDELNYLLTPVADDLTISFTLAEGFTVQEIYGFEFEDKDGEVTILGPSPPEEEEPEEPVEPEDPPEQPSVSIATVFASSKNGIVMAAVSGPKDLEGLKNLTFASIKYSYTLLDTGEKAEHTLEVELLELVDQGNGLYQFFTNAIVRRNFSVLQVGLALIESCRLFHEEQDAQAALEHLDMASTFVSQENSVLQDVALTDDLELMDLLAENIEAAMQTETAESDTDR